VVGGLVGDVGGVGGLVGGGIGGRGGGLVGVGGGVVVGIFGVGGVGGGGVVVDGVVGGGGGVGGPAPLPRAGASAACQNCRLTNAHTLLDLRRGIGLTTRMEAEDGRRLDSVG